MNIPGTYPGEHPILSLRVEGGHHLSWYSAWTKHRTLEEEEEDSYLLRHTEGSQPPFQTTECQLPAATLGGIIEGLSSARDSFQPSGVYKKES
jgi:hypothetical protein